jgi:hypothetical protein
MISNVKTNEATKKDVEESTYALIERSVDKKSAIFETILYGLIAVGAVIAIVQFIDQPFSMSA